MMTIPELAVTQNTGAILSTPPKPRWVRVVEVVTLAIIVINGVLVFMLILQLLRSGEAAIGILFSLAGVVGALFSVRKDAPPNPLKKVVPDKFASLLALFTQVLLFVVIFLGRSPLLETLARARMVDGLSQPVYSEALAAFREAAVLEGDVAATLISELQAELTSPILAISNERPIRLANLLLQFSQPESSERQSFGEWLTKQTCAVAAGGSPATQRYVVVLALTDSNTAALLAEDLNDASLLIALNQSADSAGLQPRICEVVYSNNNNTALTGHYLETVRTVDQTLPLTRSFERQSTARANLATYLQVYGTQLDTLLRARDLYLEALTLNPGNYAARYQLGALLSFEFEQFPNIREALSLAVQITHQGREQLDKEDRCDGRQNLAAAEVADKAWHCFLLLVTEARARYERMTNDVSGSDDSITYIKSLLEQAITLAEDNEHFQGRNTAEAYFYYALSLAYEGQPVDPAAWCAALEHINIRSPIQLKWQTYANNQLGSARCQR